MISQDYSRCPTSLSGVRQWTLPLIALAVTAATSPRGDCASAPLFPRTGQPFENSLGLKFVPVPGIDALFSIWETRVRDFEAFVNATGHRTEGKVTAWHNRRYSDSDERESEEHSWRNPGFTQGPDHPVCAVSWHDAQAFCRWLTQRERAAGRLGPNQSYRLPTDEEWSIAVGLPKESGSTMAEKSGKIKGVYPWGTQWPPPIGAANVCDDAAHPEGRWEMGIPGYHDDYMHTAPVGRFPANRYGIYDLGGNVWEWCQDEYSASSNWRVLRGGSFRTNGVETLLSSSRPPNHPAENRYVSLGFRVVCAPAAGLVVRNSSALSAAIAAARPGDRIVMADGTWADTKIVFKAVGTEAGPITLCAQTPGQVVLTGASYLTIAGRFLVVEGLCFKGNTTGPATHTVAFRTSRDEVASDCRLTQCAIIDYSPSDKTISTCYVVLYGQRNRVDHCYFRGKTNQSPTLNVYFNAGAPPNDHRIDHNYFAWRPPLGVNGGETVQVGWSEAQRVNSRTTVEFNYFEECNGEHEIIASKSCENIYRFNTFVRCQGVLSLRVGNRCTIEGNFFLGQNAPDSGGVHVFGEDHRIINNYFAGLRGLRFYAALSLMNGSNYVSVGQKILAQDPNGVPLHPQVRRALFAFNTIADCASPLEIGLRYDGFKKESTVPPADCVLANNIIQGMALEPVIKYHGAPTNFVWQGNIVQGDDLGIPLIAGISAQDPKLSADLAGLWRPAKDSPAIGAAVGEYTFVEEDIDGQPRPATRKDVGCDQASTAPIQRRPLTRKEVGPRWLTPADAARSLAVGANPESVTLGFGGRYYVTLMGARREKGDGDGTIATVDGANVTVFATGFDDPKGIAFTGDWLVTADFDRVWAVDATGRKKLLAGPEAFPEPPRFLNDVALDGDGKSVLVSDMGARDRMFEAPGRLWSLESAAARALPVLGRIYRVTPDGRVSIAIDHAPEMAVPNGVTMDDDDGIYVVDTFFGTVHRRRDGRWSRIGADFRGADGIAFDGNGHLFVTEVFSGRVWRVRIVDGRRELLATLRSAADLCFDAARRQLVVPDLRAGELVFLPLME